MKQKQNLQLNLFLMKIIAVITIFLSSFYYAHLTAFSSVLKGFAFLILIISSLLESVRCLAKRQKNNAGLQTFLGFIMWLTKRKEEAVLLLLICQIIEYFKRKHQVSRVAKNHSISVKRKNKIEQIPLSKIKKDMILIMKKGEVLPVDGIIQNEERKKFSPNSVDKILSGTRIMENHLEIKTMENYNSSSWAKREKQKEQVYQGMKIQENIQENYKRRILIGIGMFLIFIPNFITHKFEYFSIYLGTVTILFAMQSSTQDILHTIKEKTISKLFCQDIRLTNYQNLKKLKNVKNIIFEKTGTLTLGEFRVTGMKAKNEKQFLEYLNYVEYYSKHPIAQTIKEYKKVKIEPKKIKNFQEVQGKGVECKIEKQQVVAGNIYFLKEHGLNPKKENVVGTVIYLAVDNTYLGNIVLSDSIKYSIKPLTEDLKNNGIKNICILSGDNERINKAVSQELKINDQYSNITSKEKEFWFLHLKEQVKGKIMFIGNETTDERLLEIADVSLILNTTDEIVGGSDFFITNNKLENLPNLFKIFKEFQKEKHQTILFYIGLRGIWILLALMEALPLWVVPATEELIAIILKLKIDRKW